MTHKLKHAILLREEISAIIDRVISENMDKPPEWILGQIMKATGGAANPVTARLEISEKLGKTV